MTVVVMATGLSGEREKKKLHFKNYSQLKMPKAMQGRKKNKIH